MSKYDPLWRNITENGDERFQMTFSEIEQILGFPVDHSFLSFKKELSVYGYQVEKISMKQQTVFFERLENAE